MPNFNPDHPDDSLLEEARMAASTDREESFVADLLAARRRLGLNFTLTEPQREWLEKIAG